MDLEYLQSSARDHIAFLRAVHLCKRDLYSAGNDLKQAIVIYLDFWLPTLYDYSEARETTSVGHPPLDVAWIWHLHKIDPGSYASDCIRWYGRVLDIPLGTSPFLFSSTLSSLSPGHVLDVHMRLSEEGPFIDRIAASAKTQSTFLWQVRWSEYEDDGFLKESVNRYKMMMLLMKENPTQFIVPTYDIDNIWHTHLAYPCRYIEDCVRLAGRTIDHDDSVVDRNSSSFLAISTATTERLWQASFGTAWTKKGGMYRGEPPSWYWSKRELAATPDGAQSSHLPVSKHFVAYAVQIMGRAFGHLIDAEVRLRLTRTKTSTGAYTEKLSRI
jgi:hypothetical protein